MAKGIIRSAGDVSGTVWGQSSGSPALGHGSWSKTVNKSHSYTLTIQVGPGLSLRRAGWEWSTPLPGWTKPSILVPPCGPHSGSGSIEGGTPLPSRAPTSLYFLWSLMLLQGRTRRFTPLPSWHPCPCLLTHFQCLLCHVSRSNLSVIYSNDEAQKV